MRLQNAHVLVTGASRGIGRSVARAMAARGAVVTVVARSRGPLELLAQELGGHALVADLSGPGRRDLVAAAETSAGPVDVLVNVAGSDAVDAVVDVAPDDLEALFQVNLLAPAELCRQVIPGMVDRGRGHLVNVSSGFSAVTAQGLVPYCASKAGLSHLTAGLRTELLGTGVGTTLVELGPVKTEMYQSIQAHRVAGPALARAVRLRAVVEIDPDDVAEQVCDAVERGRQHVVLPKRMTPLLALAWLPRRASQVFLSGLPRR